MGCVRAGRLRLDASASQWRSQRLSAWPSSRRRQPRWPRRRDSLRRMGLMRARGRRSRTRRGTATRARSRTRPGRRPASTARRCSSTARARCVTVPDAASLHLSSGMTLEAWVNPSTVNANWRDVIYKGNDNFYLEATSTERLAAGRGHDRRRQLRRCLRDGRAPRQQLVVPDRDLRRRDAPPLRQRHPGRLDGAHRHDRLLHQPAPDRWRQHLRPVLRRPDRRGPRLQRRAHRRPDPDRPGDAGEQRSGHDAADAAGDADGDRGRRQRGRPGLGRLDRQRRRHRLPGRALPGRRLQQLRPDRHPAPAPATRTPASAPSTSYSYRVRATDAAGNLSPYSNTASATTPTPDTQPPTQPGTLTATAVSGQRDRPGLGRLHRQRRRHRLPGRALPGRRLHATSPRSPPPPAPATKTPASAPSTSYSYRVRATDAAGNLSPYSNIASATTPAAPTGLVAAYGV